MGKESSQALTFVAFAIWACVACASDEHSVRTKQEPHAADAQPSSDQSDYALIAAGLDAAPPCDASFEGRLVFVKSERSLYVCTDGKWSYVVAPSPPGARGSQGEPGKDGDVGKNGLDGANGKDGKNGANGSDGRNGLDGFGYIKVMNRKDQLVGRLPLYSGRNYETIIFDDGQVAQIDYAKDPVITPLDGCYFETTDCSGACFGDTPAWLLRGGVGGAFFSQDAKTVRQDGDWIARSKWNPGGGFCAAITLSLQRRYPYKAWVLPSGLSNPIPGPVRFLWTETR